MSNFIKDIAIEIGSGITPSRSNKLYWDSSDIPWVKTEQIGQYQIFDSNEYISTFALTDTNIRLWPPHTVSVAMYGEGKTRGNVSILMIETTTNQACCNIIVNETTADYHFLYYWLKNNYEKLRSLAAGVRKNLNSDDIKSFPFPNLKLSEQAKIADVLSVLDDKVQINSQICSELDAMAKTLYDYWFVQFDFPDENGKPYRTSGGEMVWNEQLKREIPKGWIIGNLYDIADFFNGIACQRFRPKENENGLPVIKIKEMHDGITKDTEFVTESIPEKSKIFDGDILFSWSATLEVMYWFGGNGGLNQHIFKVVPKGYFSNEYVYEQLSAYIINFVKMADARKTTMGHITTDHLEQSRIALPPDEIVNRFTAAVQPLHRKSGQAQQENRELMKLRDWLLPMLMNGQAMVE